MAGVTADAIPDPNLDDEHSPGRPAPTPAATRPRSTLVAAGELLRALSAPVRIAIVLQLRDHERCVHELVDALGVTQPLISQVCLGVYAPGEPKTPATHHRQRASPARPPGRR